MANPTVRIFVHEEEGKAPELRSVIDKQGLGNDDLRVKYAILTQVHADKIAKGAALPFSSISAGDRISAVITLTHNEIEGDGDPFFDYDECDDEFEEHNFEDAVPANDNSIGFSIRYSVLSSPENRPLGCAASPAFMVGEALRPALENMIKTAAGYNFANDNNESSGPGM